MIIVFLGPPGADKGTQGKLLADRYQFQHISSGDSLRREIKNGTEGGKKAQTYMDNGQLVCDELMMTLDRITGRRSCPQCGAVYHITFNPPKSRSSATRMVKSSSSALMIFWRSSPNE